VDCSLAHSRFPRMGQPLPWREIFQVGHPGLDGEHQRMVALINEIIAAVEAGEGQDRRLALIETLREVTVEHVRNENAILWELRSGAYAALQDRPRTQKFLKALAEAAFDEHMAEHDSMLAQIDHVRGLPLEQLCETLKTWFLDHAIKHDSHLKAIFQAM